MDIWTFDQQPEQRLIEPLQAVAWISSNKNNYVPVATNVNPWTSLPNLYVLFLSVFTVRCVKHWWCGGRKRLIPYWAEFDRISVTSSSEESRWRQQNLSGPSLLWTGFTITHQSALLIKHSHKDSRSSETHVWIASRDLSLSLSFTLSLPLSPRTPLPLRSHNYNGSAGGWQKRCVRKYVFLCVSAMMHFE